MRNLVLALIIIGAINWGLIGFFRYDLISNIFGELSLHSLVSLGFMQSHSLEVTRLILNRTFQKQKDSSLPNGRDAVLLV